MKSGRGPLLDHLDALEKKCTQGDPSLQDIFKIFGPDGHYVLITFLILPFLQPIPLIGLSTPFGILIALIGIVAYLQKPPWLPHKWTHKKIPAHTVTKIAEGSERIFEKLSFMLHPRLRIVFAEPFRTLNVVLLVFSAILLALPLPIPFSNALPAWMILFHSLGQLEEDGIFITLSYLQTIVCVAYFVLIYEGVGIGLTTLGLE